MKENKAFDLFYTESDDYLKSILIRFGERIKYEIESKYVNFAPESSGGRKADMVIVNWNELKGLIDSNIIYSIKEK